MRLFGLAFMSISVLLTSSGKDGDDGLDGNANARAFRFDFTEVDGTFHRHYMSEITVYLIQQ